MSSDREQWRLKGFSASVCHFQRFLLPLLLCFFLSAASQFAAEGKTGKLPKEARAAQPRAPPREASGARRSACPETSLATPSPDALARGPGPFIQASRFVSSPRVWRSHTQGLAHDSPFFLAGPRGSVSVAESGELLSRKRGACCNDSRELRFDQQPRGLSDPTGDVPGPQHLSTVSRAGRGKGTRVIFCRISEAPMR